MTDIQNQLSELLDLFQRASAAVLDIYDNQTLAITIKSDDSPVTQADITAHNIITHGLQTLFPAIPVVSEEGNQQANSEMVRGNRFWLVDPLDGTKEFIAHNGEFVVCAGLIENSEPSFGIVAVPATGVLYYGDTHTGSFMIEPKKAQVPISTNPERTGIVLGGKSHGNNPINDFIAQHFADYELKTMGSLLKFLEIAKGNADAFPRISHSMKLWDVAAGHAILQGAGGSVTRPDGSPLNYNNPSLLIGDFVARS